MSHDWSEFLTQEYIEVLFMGTRRVEREGNTYERCGVVMIVPDGHLISRAFNHERLHRLAREMVNAALLADAKYVSFEECGNPLRPRLILFADYDIAK